MAKILFIQTGGTIDKDYPKKIKSYAFEIADPAVKRVLKIVKPGFSYEIVPLLQKDSLDITQKDREKIRKVCEKSSIEKIIITHGTDTMVQTAEVLCGLKKTIVLTGALIPERFLDSDAPFNIGIAVGAIDFLGKGVYIAMSGKIFPWEKCRKSVKTARFIQK